CFFGFIMLKFGKSEYDWMMITLDAANAAGPKKQNGRYIFLPWKLPGKRKVIGQQSGESDVFAANEAKTHRQRDREGRWFPFLRAHDQRETPVFGRWIPMEVLFLWRERCD
ncbi:MAG: hypothetical protein PUB22_05660, partial [Clostridiales bacterium]|nr:hypothetical protein [Clostridiales bacterium]